MGRQATTTTAVAAAAISTSTSTTTRGETSAVSGLLSSLAVTVCCSIGASLLTAVLVHHIHRRTFEQAQTNWSDRRQEERTGRIRAEVKLRTALKDLEQTKLEHSFTISQRRQNNNGQKEQQEDEARVLSSSLAVVSGSNGKKTEEEQEEDNQSDHPHLLLLRCIGTVQSPYTKRMGTPRQPQLVPSSRGRIEFRCPAAALDGIEEYSHIFVIFGFHANTNTTNNHQKTKIRPPRAGGKKVGQLATRSPHRPNCIGLSLVCVELWDPKSRTLHISGLDLVHGTPVYDIKPCVPWDVPNFYHNPSISSALFDPSKNNNNFFRVPDWVQQSDDELSQVQFTQEGLNGLQSVLAQGSLAPFYTIQNDGEVAAKAALEEILSQDPRSSHKGLKANARGTTTTTKTNNNNNNNDSKDDDAYSLTFGQCQVFFRVLPSKEVQVIRVTPFDADGLEYADGIPLLSLKQQQQQYY